MTESDRFFSIYRKVLYWGTLGLAEFHLLWSLMQFVIWQKPYLKLEKWVGLALVAGMALYLVLAALSDSKNRAAAFGQAATASDRSDNSGPAMAPIKDLLQRVKSPEQIFLAVFFGWYIVVCVARSVLERRSYFSANDNRLFYAALTAFVLFPLAAMVGREKVKRTVDVMLFSAVAAYTPVCAWVVWNFYQGVFVNLPSGNVVKLYQGLSLMIGVHRNTTAAYSLILMSICVYFLVSMKSKVKYAIFIPAAVVHFFVIILSNSRTCYLVLIAMIIVPALVRGSGYLKRVRVKHKGLMVAGAVLVLAAVVVALYFARSGIIASNAETWREKLNNPDAMRVRKMVGLNGRINIWKASVKLMLSSWDRFLFGVTPPKLPSVLWDIGKFPVKQPNCHNLYLQVGTCFGFPMMLMYIWFTISIAIRGLRVMKSDSSALFKGAWVIPVIVFGILMTDMLEVLSFVNSFFNLPVFYLLSGWIVLMDTVLTGQKGRKPA